MPLTRSVKKSLRQSQKKAEQNKPARSLARTWLKKARSEPTQDNLKKAFSVMDKAVKKNLFHKNKISRLKSRLVRLAKKTSTPKTA